MIIISRNYTQYTNPNKSRVYKQHRITDVEGLRQRTEEECDRLDQEVIDNTINEWRK